MLVLEKLWRGTLSLDAGCSDADGEYDALRQELLQKEKQVAAELSPEKRNLFQAYQEIRAQMSAICEEEAFVSGFRLGVRMLLDSLL